MLRAALIEREPCYILGVQTRVNPRTADYRSIWELGFSPRRERISSVAISPNYYGAYYGTGEKDQVDFVAGMIIRGDVTVPEEGLTLRRIDGGRYAVFECAMSQIASTWQAIYGTWFSETGNSEDESRTCLEEYPPDVTGPDSLLRIFVPIRS